MTHEEDDDQGERLINEGKKKLENTWEILYILTLERVQDMEEEQPFLVRYDSRVSYNPLVCSRCPSV
jgi:hypothetical protein